MATQIKQIYYNVMQVGSDGQIALESSKENIDIFKDLIAQVLGENGKNLNIQLGIQAPPGTHFQLNGQTMIMGASGTFEPDRNIKIEELFFIRPKSYIANKEETLNKLREAYRDISNANFSSYQFGNTASEQDSYTNVVAGEDYLRVVESKEDVTNDDLNKLEKYVIIQDKFFDSYAKARRIYELGKQGVFTQSTQEDDLYNILVDMIVEG